MLTGMFATLLQKKKKRKWNVKVQFWQKTFFSSRNPHSHPPSPGPYAVWYGAIPPPDTNPPYNDVDGYPGSSRRSAATHPTDPPQPHSCFLHDTFLLPGTSTGYVCLLEWHLCGGRGGGEAAWGSFSGSTLMLMPQWRGIISCKVCVCVCVRHQVGWSGSSC